MSMLLVLSMVFVALAGCGDGNPAESTPGVTTPENTPEATPKVTEPQIETYSIAFDLDGGIDGGNPTTYNAEEGARLIAPIRVGYDFVGWTGSGLTEPTVSVTVEKGTTGDLSFKANWEENGDLPADPERDPDDIIAKIYSKQAKGAIVTDDYANAYAVQAANDLQALFEAEDVTVRHINERYVEDGDYDLVFCFGKTKFEDSDVLLGSFDNYLQYGVHVTADRVCVIGWSESAFEAAFAIFDEIFEHVTKGGRLSDYEGALFKGETADHVCGDIPMIDGFSGVTDAGEGAWHVYKIDSSIEDYNDYISRLEKRIIKKLKSELEKMIY